MERTRRREARSRLWKKEGSTEEQTIQLTPALISMLVLAHTADAVYLRLPRELQREVEGGCDCGECKRDPRLARWDTLVVPIKTDPRRVEHSHTVHLPDGALERFRQRVARREAHG